MLSFLMVTLLWTNPCYNVRMNQVYDFESGDSIAVSDCGYDGTILTDLDHLDFYGWPATAGGVNRFLFRYNVRGKECRPDSTTFDTQGLPWHIYFIPYDLYGNGECKSNIVYYGSITGVPVTAKEKPIKTLIFDVRGRLIPKCEKLAAGVYLVRTIYKDKEINSKMVVLK